jgi:hypothetical protein
MFLIICSAIVAVVETIPSIHKSQTDLWFGLESTFVLFFTIEFVCRFISSFFVPGSAFFTTIMNYIDLIAILPYYMDVISMLASAGEGGPNFGFLRILRLSRAARLIKLSKYSQGIRLVTNAMANSIDALQLFALLLTLVLVVFSSGIYYTERGEWVDVATGCPQDWYNQFGAPDPGTGNYTDHCIVNRYYRKEIKVGGTDMIEQYPSPFQSIPQSFWWCIVTLTTVGYGDMYPYSVEGKVVGVLTMLVGLIMLALPLSIIGTNFIEERNLMVEENKRRLEDKRKDEVGITEVEEEEKPKFNMRKDLREVLAKADQLYDSTYDMTHKLQRCAELLKEMKGFKINNEEHIVDTDETVPEAGALAPTVPSSGKGASSGAEAGDVEVEMAESSSMPHHASHLYAVPVSAMDELKELCLGVLKTAVQEMKIWDPQGDLPEMPSQILHLLQSEKSRGEEKREAWKERLAQYENISAPAAGVQDEGGLGSIVPECAIPRVGCT